jgi:DNA polymerase III epsilon subunit-like protein
MDNSIACYNATMKIIFFDTETTGIEPKDRLCQIAWMEQGGSMRNGLFKPPFLVPAEASAVHHISNKMLADKLAFKESPEWKEIKELFESDDTVVVAHNAKFDLGMLAKEDIVPKHHICTLRVARAMDPECALSNYKLQYLRYKLDLEVDESAAAHSADGDVLVLEKLFERLLGKIMTQKSKEDALKEMIDITSLPSIIKTFNFGKHAGKAVAEVAKTDSGYLDWLLKSKLADSPDDEDWIYTLKVSLGKLI